MKPKHTEEARGRRAGGVLIAEEASDVIVLLQNAAWEACSITATRCAPFLQLRNLFLDQASSLNGGSEKINQQNLLKSDVFLKIHSLYS